MIGTQRIVVVGAALACTVLAGRAEAWPGGGSRSAWSAGPTFNGAAPASFTWTQYSVATSAVGNSNQIIGSTGPITVNQTSGPVFVFSGVPAASGANAWSLAGLLVSGGGGQSGTGVVNVGQGANGGLVQANTGGVTTNGAGSGTTVNGLAAPPASSGGATPTAGNGAASGGGSLATLPGAVARGAGAAASTLPGSVGVGAGTGLGAGSSVQLCASCLTGGVGG